MTLPATISPALSLERAQKGVNILYLILHCRTIHLELKINLWVNIISILQISSILKLGGAGQYDQGHGANHCRARPGGIELALRDQRG